MIEPAIAAGRSDGIAADGRFPADTVFLRTKDGAFDAVLTMSHDEGQIAMKRMGFDRGVTLLAGFPSPIFTPAHSTAYDIAGQGIASIGARRAAARRRNVQSRPAGGEPTRRANKASRTPPFLQDDAALRATIRVQGGRLGSHARQCSLARSRTRRVIGIHLVRIAGCVPSSCGQVHGKSNSRHCDQGWKTQRSGRET